MLIIATNNQLEKKCMKSYHKVIISDISEDSVMGIKKSILAKEFLPDPSLFLNYANGVLSKKRYKKEYWKELEGDEDKFISLLTMMIMYRKGGNLCISCDKEEKGYMYVTFLAEYIQERYGIKIGTYEDVKKGTTTKNKIGNDKLLEKDIKCYREELESIVGYKSKKKDKKKDKKKKKKDDYKYKYTEYNKDTKKKKGSKSKGKSKKKEMREYEDKKVRKTIENYALRDSRYNDNEYNIYSKGYIGNDIELVDSVVTKRLFKNR